MTPKEKQNFHVKVELLVPVTITYNVRAEDAQQALIEVDKFTAQKLSTQQHWARRLKIRSFVYQPYTNILKLSKTYRSIS